MTDIAALPADPPKKKFGGYQVGAGRPKGSGDKISKDLKDLCKSFAPEAVDILMKIARDNKANNVARIAAVNSILDRGFGKPNQTISGDPDNPPIVSVQVTYLTGQSNPLLNSSKFRTEDASSTIIDHDDLIQSVIDDSGDGEDYDTTVDQ